MAFYRDRVFLPVMNRVMDDDEHRRIRSVVCAPLAGEVVEIGFGTGLNLPHLPATVTRLYAVDPLERGRLKAAERVAASPVAVEFVGLDGQSLPLGDESADAALSTWTLCSVTNPLAAVRGSGGSCDRAGCCTSPSTGSQPIQRSRRGNAAWTACSSDWRAAAT